MSYIEPCLNIHDFIANLRQLAKEYPSVYAIDLGPDGGRSSVGFATFNFQIHGWLSTLINAGGLNSIDPARTVNIKIRPDETVFELVRFLQRHKALQTSGAITPAMLADALERLQSGGGKVTNTPTGAAGESEGTKPTGGKRKGRKPLKSAEQLAHFKYYHAWIEAKKASIPLKNFVKDQLYRNRKIQVDAAQRILNWCSKNKSLDSSNHTSEADD